jgi:hypothetical protein
MTVALAAATLAGGDDWTTYPVPPDMKGESVTVKLNSLAGVDASQRPSTSKRVEAAPLGRDMREVGDKLEATHGVLLGEEADMSAWLLLGRARDNRTLGGGEIDLWRGVFVERVGDGDWVTVEEGFLPTHGQFNLQLFADLPERAVDVGVSPSGSSNGVPSLSLTRKPVRMYSAKIPTDGGTETEAFLEPDGQSGQLFAWRLHEPSASTGYGPGVTVHSGNAGATLTTKRMRIAVEAVAPDWSEATFRVLPIDLPALRNITNQRIGSPLPVLSAYDILGGRQLSNRDLLELARKSKGLVLVFGECFTASSPHQYVPPGSASALPLAPGQMAETAAALAEGKPPAIAIAVTRLTTPELFRPDRTANARYTLLSDFMDPVRLSVTTETAGSFNQGTFFAGGRPAAEPERLRDWFGVLPEATAIIAFDARGRVTYSNPNVDAGFTAAFSEAVLSVR